MIQVTEKAVNEIKRIQSQDNTATNPTDKVFEHAGVKLVVDAKSYLYLAGTELDFTDGLNGTGFVFNNPNAKRTCGCGSSFST
jgi:iron-sulfur cluster assembly accessory protein